MGTREDDDDDTGEFWRAVHAQKAEKRAHNRESTADILKRAGVQFESRNVGAHLIVKHGAHLIDAWPGTGLWRTRAKPQREGRGVRKLLKHMGLVMPADPITPQPESIQHGAEP